jgi:hypothetical protein
MVMPPSHAISCRNGEQVCLKDEFEQKRKNT